MPLRSFDAPAVALQLVLCLSCGGEARSSAPQASAGKAGDAQAGGGAGDVACGRGLTPKEHRAVARACPAGRGSSGPIDTSACVNRTGITCTKDADCSAGLNGRCIAHNEPCDTACSYDECQNDADCAAGPCLCRTDDTAADYNQCLPGSTCKTDADCGSCGYCSASAARSGPSCRVEAITYSYHTASDRCLDQSDCYGGYCAYDQAPARWACGSCVPIPHP